MRLVPIIGVGLIAIAATAFGQQQSAATAVEPIVQVRTVEQGRNVVARGLTIEVPRTADGLRYFYSETAVFLTGSGWSTVESWSQQDGKPKTAVYRSQSGKGPVREIRFEFSDAAVTITDSAKKKSSSFVLAPEDQVVLSQFNPADLINLSNGPQHLLIVGPENQVPLSHRVEDAGTEKVLVQGEVVDVLRRFKLTSKAGWSLIKTSPQGTFRFSENSKGQIMRVVEPTAEEVARARALLARLG